MWFFKRNNVTVGPIAETEIQDYVSAGVITPETWIRISESDPWMPARSVNGFLTVEEVRQAVIQSVNEKEIRFHCPACKQRYRMDPSAVGDSVVCTQCGINLKITLPTLKNDFFAAQIPEGPIVCPHCWQKFSLDHLYYIAAHPELVGDSVLGSDAPLRFLPTIFNATGLPLDSRGMVCTDMACPRCHLRIPSTVIDVPSLYFSIVGAPASGKSYFLTSMIHRVKEGLPKYFDLAFFDADPLTNAVVSRYEQILFMAKKRDEIVMLPKTQQVGSEFSSQVLLNGMTVDLPKPTLFLMQTLPSHYAHAKPNIPFPRNIVFYDNAGEHFQPGTDTVGNPASQHLPHSNGIIFLFDPTEDVRMRPFCDVGDPQVRDHVKVTDQGLLFSEMVSRLRRHHNLKAGEKSSVPLVVAVGKYDVWESHFSYPLRKSELVTEDKEMLSWRLNLQTVMNISFRLREKMLDVSPDLVNTAESFFERVIFVPVSSFGNFAQESESGALGIRPDMIHPIWVETPFYVLLQQLGYVPATEKMPADIPASVTMIENYKISDNAVVFSVDGAERIQLPKNYLGHVIEIKGKPYLLPSHPEMQVVDQLADEAFWDL